MGFRAERDPEKWATAPAPGAPQDNLTPRQAAAPAAVFARAQGAVRVTARRRDALTVLDKFRHSGSAKALFPGAPSERLDAVLLNTAGGVTGGDHFHYEAEAGDGAWLRLATQTAERAYRAIAPETGHLDVTLRARDNARLDWLPQETILFDGARLRRRITVDLAESARFLAVEALVFGRAAMGETVHSLALSDQWRVRRGGRLVYADALRLHGDAAAILARPGVANGARAMASMVYIGPDAAQRLDPLRATLPETAGASLIRDGVLAARLLAADGFRLRHAITAALAPLADAPPPKVWML